MSAPLRRRRVDAVGLPPHAERYVYPAPAWSVPEGFRLRRLEHRLEPSEEAFDPSVYVGECLGDGKSISEACFAGELEVHVHMGITARDFDGQSVDLCINFQRPPKEALAVQHKLARDFAIAVAHQNRLHIRGNVDNGEHHAMLVLVPELLQVGELMPLSAMVDGRRVRTRVAPPVARLRPVDHCPMLRENPSELLRLDAGAVPAVLSAPLVAAGKRVGWAWDLTFGSQERQLEGEVVEAGPQTMHELTDDGCQPQVRLVDPADHPPEDVLVVRLHLGANNCGVDFAREKDIKFTVQKLGVLLCPPELLLRTTQRMRVRKPLPVPVHPALPLEGDARQAAKTNRRADGADAEGPDGPGGWHI